MVIVTIATNESPQVRRYLLKRHRQRRYDNIQALWHIVTITALRVSSINNHCWRLLPDAAPRAPSDDEDILRLSLLLRHCNTHNVIRKYVATYGMPRVIGYYWLPRHVAGVC